MSPEIFDVAIVGAGPAGNAAAQVLAEQDLEIVILERRSTVGVPIQCGEFLTTPSEIARMFPSSPRAQKLVDVPESIIANQCDTLRLV